MGELCGPECNCTECCNNSANLNIRAQTIESILEKNPYAFNSKSKKSENSSINLNNVSGQNNNNLDLGGFNNNSNFVGMVT